MCRWSWSGSSRKTLAKDPERRYQSGAELIVDLETLKSKLGAESSLGPSATPGSPSQRFPATTPEQASRLARPTGRVHAEEEQPLRKRQVRERVLDLGNKGLLPDSILSQALEVISRSTGEGSEETGGRNHLLDDLLYERIQVGEFIEQWHRLESGQEAPEVEATDSNTRTKKKRKSRDVRSQAEVFGIPLYHCACGRDPSTGQERVAKGVVAFGNISVGLVACASWLAIGGIAVSPVSIGLWAFGLIAIGLNAVGLFQLSLNELSFWQALLITIAAVLIGGFVLAKRKVHGPTTEGAIDELALFSSRQWRVHREIFRGGRVVAICGHYVLDLTEAQLPSETTTIVATAICGAVRIQRAGGPERDH